MSTVKCHCFNMIQTYIHTYILTYIHTYIHTYIKGLQTVQHIIYDCPLLEKEREKLKAVVTRTENLPVSCNKLGVQ